MRIGDNRGEVFTSIATIITVAVIFVLGGMSAVLEVFSEPEVTAPAAVSEPVSAGANVVHTGVVSNVEYSLAGGDVTTVKFEDGAAYVLPGSHLTFVWPGRRHSILSTPHGLSISPPGPY